VRIKRWRKVLRDEGIDGPHRIAAAKAEGALRVAAKVVTRP
jgi:hypothetical protein